MALKVHNTHKFKSWVSAYSHFSGGVLNCQITPESIELTSTYLDGVYEMENIKTLKWKQNKTQMISGVNVGRKMRYRYLLIMMKLLNTWSCVGKCNIQ